MSSHHRQPPLGRPPRRLCGAVHNANSALHPRSRKTSPCIGATMQLLGSGHSMQRLKTYIVEDSPVIRDSLVAALEEMAPIEVVGVAEDEAGAVQWLTTADNAADLVIIDIFLKRGSGLGVLRLADRAEQHRTMVVLSNHATPEMRRQCTELGASKVFDKSNELDALMLYCERLASGEAGNSHRGELN